MCPQAPPSLNRSVGFLLPSSPSPPQADPVQEEAPAGFSTLHPAGPKTRPEPSGETPNPSQRIPVLGYAGSGQARPQEDQAPLRRLLFTADAPQRYQLTHASSRLAGQHGEHLREL